MNIRSKKLDDWDIPDDVKQYIRDLRQENGRLRTQLTGKGMQVRPGMDILPVKARKRRKAGSGPRLRSGVVSSARPRPNWPRSGPRPKMAEVHPKTLWDQAYNRSGTLPKHRTVLNALRTWANPQTLRCFAKLEDIAEWTGLSTSACWRQIETNEAAGWIEIVHQGHSGGKANEYRLLNPGVHARVSQGTANENPSVHEKTLASTLGRP